MKRPLDASYRALAARYVRRQVKQLTGQVEGIRKAEDIECVHRARVACRRLQSVLSVFEDCFPSDRVRCWIEEVRRLGRGLGKARDQDVQIEFVTDLLAHVKDRDCLPGVTTVLARCQRQREKTQPKVLRLLRKVINGPALDEIRAATKKLTRAADDRNGTDSHREVFRRAEKHITARLRELWEFEPCLANPDDSEQHHAMRIAVKRLRYTMEVFKLAFDGALDRAIEAVKQVQSLLGDVHDCDVWISQLDKMLAKQARRLRRAFGHTRPLERLRVGIDYLKQDRQRRRRELFETLVAFWREQTEAGLWDDLVQVVRSRGAQPKEPDPQPRSAWRLGPSSGNGSACPAVGGATASSRDGGIVDPSRAPLGASDGQEVPSVADSPPTPVASESRLSP